VDLNAGDNEVAFNVPLTNILRWDLDHPNLYRMTVELLDKDRLLDSASDGFGLRDLRDPRPAPAAQRSSCAPHGMTRHTDSPWDWPWPSQRARCVTTGKT
jgi:hypothetical protein